MNLIYIAGGGAAGALLRYGMSNGVHALFGRGFPYGTLAVNVLGSILIGLCYVFLVERPGVDPYWRAALMIGLLGSFTTFSTFSMETLNLLEGGQPLKAAINILLSVTFCIAGAWAGLTIGRRL
ncbi:MAG: fluoride efflux transporter CrcB [Gammaproteobacteria bacterium]